MIAVVKELPLRVRRMRQSDVVAVAAIERKTYDFPWTPGIFRDCLLAGYASVVLESVGKVVGYGIVSVAAGEAHLLNICIEDNLRGQGVGRRLLENLLAHARATGAERVFLEVRPSNHPARSLYRSAGFDVIGVRKGYYRARGGKEDAVVLLHRFTDPD
jgi:ribosomal-protein-alanine N-acetyltransferase